MLQQTIEFMSDILNNAGVHLIFLPTYSPELNPCENVFGYVKNWLRKYRGTRVFWQEMMIAFARVDHSLISKWYAHCRKIDRIV